VIYLVISKLFAEKITAFIDKITKLGESRMLKRAGKIKVKAN